MTARGCVAGGFALLLAFITAFAVLRLWEGTDTLTWRAP